ncbi:retrotransposon protein, putative, ty1-copia subclass [Tanacetum coccineum]
MPASQEHMHLAWLLWSDLRFIPTHGKFCSLVRPLAIFARSCLVDLIRQSLLTSCPTCLLTGQTSGNKWEVKLDLSLKIMTTSIGNNSVFRSFFEKQKLTGPNFIDWYRQLRLVLSTEDKEKYLDQPIPPTLVAAAPDQPIPHAALTTYNKWVKNQKEIAEEGQYVSSYVLKMKSYIDQLEHLDHPVTLNLGVSLILVGLSKEYDSFVQNYNMYSMGKSVNELHAMLKLHEETLPKKVVAPALHAIKAEKVQKNKNKKPSKAAKGVQGKGKRKMVDANDAPSYAPKPKNPLPPKKDNPAKDAICNHCGEVGHWRRNCPTYLTELLKKKSLAQGASTSSIFTIELFSYPSTSWVYDTGCGTHICNTTQGLWGSKKLNPRALSLHVGNGQREAVKAIGNYPYNKRAKLNLDSSLLWHCRLGHISKKRIEKLQHDGLLNSTNIESLGKCVSCMSGKMARKPYSHQVERAKDLLGLIHTDVCGPFRIVSRQGANYFVTFIDDNSRYGFVYLLKHKHEVFETFKVFQKEVENQLGKTIKSLRYDRGGEYMSQEFLDHLKKHGIIAHRTPPYTPQHNGVSERRNRTLLNMVRSMMSQTTLPNSFWDYALESAARILNMVPTKKVDKTPYEIWHGKAPKLSYLKVWGCEALVKRDTLTKPDKLEPRSFKYQEASGSLEDLEIIQEEDTNPSLDTSLNHEEDDQEIDER